METAAIWNDFSARLRGFIKQRVDDPDDAEDVLQTVFYKIHRGLDGLKEDARIEPWIFRITRNTITDYYRERAAERTVDAAAETAIVEDPEPSPAEPILSCLHPIIDNLPDMYREALHLTEREGLSQADLARRLGISVSGAKSRVQRGRAMIKDIILACCHLEFDARGNVIDVERRAGGCLYCNPQKASDC